MNLLLLYLRTFFGDLPFKKLDCYQCTMADKMVYSIARFRNGLSIT